MKFKTRPHRYAGAISYLKPDHAVITLVRDSVKLNPFNESEIHRLGKKDAGETKEIILDKAEAQEGEKRTSRVSLARGRRARERKIIP